MESNPGGDNRGVDARDAAGWDTVLAHRVADQAELEIVRSRFIESGLTPEDVQAVLSDGGDALYAAARSGDVDWWDPFGGALAVALLAAEVGAMSAHLNGRASGIRSLAVDGLMDDFSAVAVASALGVSRQKVYDIAKGGLRPPYIDTVPWRAP